jgi:ATP:ADP antiporter, AAA family
MPDLCPAANLFNKSKLSMQERLFSLRATQAGEKYPVPMLLAQSLLLGIFIGALDITAHSLFLAVFDEKILARGYALSGLTGVVMLAVYFFFRKRTNPSGFTIVIFASIAVVSTLLWLSSLIIKSDGIRFLLFILLGPLNIITVMSLKASAGIVLNAGVRKMLPAIETTLIIGIILISLAIPLLLFWGVTLQIFLLIGSLSAFAAAILMVALVRRTGSELWLKSGEYEDITRPVSILNIFRKSRLAGTLALFVLLSVTTSFFIQYSFLAVTREQFPSAEEIAGFLGIFTGGLMLFMLTARFILFSWLLKNYGLKICLAAAPVVLAIVTLIAAVTGTFMGYSKATQGGFIVFFVLLALLRLISKVMDETLETPSFRLLYQTMGENSRPGVRTFMDTSVKEAAVLIAGIWLAGFGLPASITLIWFSWLQLLIIAAWFLVAFRLWSEYRSSLDFSLHPDNRGVTTDDLTDQAPLFTGRYYGERLFRMDYFNLISGDYSNFESSKNKYYFSKLLDSAEKRNDISLLPAVKRLTGSGFSEDIRNRASEFIRNLNQLKSEKIRDEDKNEVARKILSETRMPQTTEILRLMREKSLESKRLGLYMIGKFKLTDLLPEVCECFNIQGLEIDTAAIIDSFGGAAEEELIRYYLVSSSNQGTSKTIMRLLSKLPLSDGAGFLFSRLWSNSRQLREVALKCLTDFRFRPNGEERERLNTLVSDVVGIMTWNLAARRCLEKSRDELLLNEFNKELGRWENFLINLLSVTYDQFAVTRIRESLQAETVESVHYAHAIIDLVTDDQIKAKLIYLLDVTEDDEKLRNLSRFFPVEVPGYDALLEEILNRDYNLLSVWTKACVLRYMDKIKGPEMAESVVALLFSPETILQEEAVMLIVRSDINLYKTVYSRIPVLSRKNLDRIIGGETDERENLFNKVKFLLTSLNDVNEEELLFLARKLTFQKDMNESVASLPDGYVLWNVTDKDSDNQVSIIYSPAVEELLEKVGIIDHLSAYVLSFKALDEFMFQYPGTSDKINLWLEACGKDQ